MTTPPTSRKTPRRLGNPEALRDARARDSSARRERVLTAITQLQNAGEHLTISSVARTARVHRSFLHRHPDLTAALHTGPRGASSTSRPAAPASDASLRAELANAHEAHRRLAAYSRRLEHRLSETLGHEVFRAAGITDSRNETDTATLVARIHELQQQVTELQTVVAERDDDLHAARDANRQLIAASNRSR